jgi:glycine/serine hydroxymethyltransferase
VDPEVQNIIDKETWRQYSGLELIASEVCGGFAMGDLVFSDNDGKNRI